MNLRLQKIDSGEFFVLTAKGNDGTLPVDINSPIFNAQQDFLGSLSYQGVMPLEPNRKLINNRHYINTTMDNRQMDVMIWLGSLPWKQAIMYWTVQTPNINYNLYIDSAAIANLLKTLLMTQLSDPGINDQVNLETAEALKDYMMAAAAADPGQYPMTFFPFKNDGGYNDAAYVDTPVYKNTIPYFVGNKVLFTNNRIYQCTVNTASGQDPITWGPLQIINTVKWEDITVYIDIALPVSKIINRWELDLTGAGSFIVSPGGGPYDQTIMPAFYLVYILKRIAHFLGYTTQGLWLREDNANKLVVQTNAPVTNTFLIADYFNFMPAMNVGDFLKVPRSEIGLFIDFDQIRKVMTIESLENLVNDGRVPTVDLQEFQLEDGYREISTQTNAWQITQKADSNDKAWENTRDQDFPNVTIGDANTAINVNQVQLVSVATKMIIEQTAVNKAYILPIVPIYSQWRIPWVKMPVAGETPLDQVSTLAFADRNNFGLRILYYHGIQKDDGGFDYPYGSADNKNVHLEAITDYSLDITDLSGIFVPLLYYFNFLLWSKPFEAVFQLIDQAVVKIQGACRIIARDPFNFSAVKCILSLFSADLTPDKEKIPAKLTLYPIILADNKSQVTSTVFTPPPPPVDNGVVYVRLDFRNVVNTSASLPPPAHTSHTIDIYAQFFADAGATTPKNVTALPIRIQTLQETISVTFGTTDLTTYFMETLTSAFNPVNGMDEAAVLIGAPTDYSVPDETITWVYTLMPGAPYNVL